VGPWQRTIRPADAAGDRLRVRVEGGITVTGTPLLERPTSPPRPPEATPRAERRNLYFAIIVGIGLLAAVVLVALLGLLDRAGTDVAPVGPADEQIEPAAPAAPAEPA
jgi:hypothetical protein